MKSISINLCSCFHKKSVFTFICILLILNTFLASGNDQVTVDTSHITAEATPGKISVLIGSNFLHYTPTSSAKDLSWKTAPFNLGGEILLAFPVSQKWRIYSGCNYQCGKIEANLNYYGDRTKFHEISLPVLTDLPSFNLFKSEFLVQTGFYFGAYAKIKRETKGSKTTYESNNWNNYPINYKDDRFICDFYLGIQNHDLNSLSPVNFIFFLKHQLNTNYLSKDISKFIFGLQIKLGV